MVFQKGNNFGSVNKGRKFSPKIKKKISKALKGRVFTQEHRRKIALSRIGEKHPLWAGDNVSKTQLHQWVKRHKYPVELCENCKIKPALDLANISQKYKRDVNDFKWLCRRCHMIEDGRLYKRLNGKYARVL